MSRSIDTQALKVAASENFKILDVDFVEIHDAGNSELHGFEPETFDIFAHLSAKFEGKAPKSYRVLNALVLDWVDENKDKLIKLVAPEVIKHYDHEESQIDTSAFEEQQDDFIWDEQVDYMPMIEDDDRLHIELELVFDIEENKEKPKKS